MKKIIYALIFVLIALNANSQTTNSKIDSAKIMFVDTIYDFGTINEADGKVSHIFKFTNVGSMPLIVLNAKASCGCTVPEWTKTPVEPGADGTIEVTFNPSRRSGNFHKTITITTNAAEQVSFLHVKGTINPAVTTEIANMQHKLKRHFGVWDYILGSAGIVIIVIALTVFFKKKKKSKIEN